jgi:hypothetical protein
MNEPVEYCVVHDRPLDWCPDQDRCREKMTEWGLYKTDSGDTLPE